MFDHHPEVLLRCLLVFAHFISIRHNDTVTSWENTWAVPAQACENWPITAEKVFLGEGPERDRGWIEVLQQQTVSFEHYSMWATLQQAPWHWAKCGAVTDEEYWILVINLIKCMKPDVCHRRNPTATVTLSLSYLPRPRPLLLPCQKPALSSSTSLH